MKKTTLRPYPGTVIVCKTKKEYRREHLRRFKREACDLSDKHGRLDGEWNPATGGIYLVWAVDTPRLAHELSHVILEVFAMAGIDPRQANGEPFCYLLSQLMLDVA